MDVPNGAELVGVAGGSVVDDLEIERGLFPAIFFGPFGEMGNELLVGDDEHLVDVFYFGEVVDDVFEHRLARHGQERLGLIEGERITPGGVACGEDEDLHKRFILEAWNDREQDRKWH
jgi:hypothetical protein